jgi:uncharacterized protein with gpF-like domain
MNKLLILITLLFVVGTLGAQEVECPGKSPYWGLNCFLSSDFMVKFETARTKAEQSVRDFKKMAASEEYSDEDIERVMDAYNKSANRFNDVLYKIKADILDKKKRKIITQSPTDYSTLIEAELDKAKQVYANSYQKAITEVTGGKITGTPFLLLLPEIIKYGKLAFEIFQRIKAEIKKYNEGLMEEYLVEPNRFHSWEELE